MTLVTLVAAALFALLGRSAQSHTASPAPAAGTVAPAAAGSVRIAFTRNTGPMSGDPKELYVMNADGSGLKRLARITSFSLLPPAWSPDGRRLALSVFHGRNAGIDVVNADGSGQRSLTRTSGYAFFPVWSPDGRKLVFVRLRDEGVYVINADGSGYRKLADDASQAAPAWSPDGRKIVFVSNRDGPARCTLQPGCNTEIYVMNADGSGQRNLTRNPSHDTFFPDIQATVAQHSPWSPDGRKLVFVSNRDGRGGCSWQPGCNTEIYVMNADGSGQRNLTRNPAHDEDPVWSPDGRKIAFVSRRDGNGDVYVMNADGSGQRNLTRSPGRDSAPAWSPDGRTIAFQSTRDRNAEIYVMNADGSGQRNLTRYRNNEFSFAWSPAQTK